MKRPDFLDIYMRLAVDLSNRSSCARLRVGCAIVSPDFRKVLAVGYNGNASKLPNRCDSDEPGKCGCLHAEENAIINCDVPRATSKIVLCSHLPCAMCAKRMINVGGVERVYYLNDYRIRDGLTVLQMADIYVTQYRIGDIQ